MVARTEYDKRDGLQAELHLTYGQVYNTNIDSAGDIFVEISDDGEKTLAFVEYKNDKELIKPFLLRAIKNDCDKLDKPFYLSILYRKPMIHYYLVPLNDQARKLPNMSQPKFWTEKQYVWLLHHLRNKKMRKEQLDKFSHELPNPLSPLNPYLCNIKEFIKE